MKRYEGMFLFDSSVAREWAAIEQEVKRLCSRIDAELLVCVKFDERRLAYEIKRRRRGTYVLTYFDAPSDRIADMERDARLSELILRLLVLRAEGLSEERLVELKAHPVEDPLEPLSGDGRRHDDDRYGRGGFRGGRGERGGRGDRGDRGAPRPRSSEPITGAPQPKPPEPIAGTTPPPEPPVPVPDAVPPPPDGPAAPPAEAAPATDNVALLKPADAPPPETEAPQT